MAFLLYGCEPTNKGSLKYSRLRRVSLAGRGVIAEFLDHRPEADKPEWEVSESDLLQFVGISHEDHAIVIDLKPTIKGQVSLYRIRHIWGFTPDGFTPILLRLEALFVDRETADPDGFKQEFDDGDADHSTVFEFLYLNWDDKRKVWNWGRSGNVNGALLFPDSLPYFLGILEQNSE